MFLTKVFDIDQKLYRSVAKMSFKYIAKYISQ